MTSLVRSAIGQHHLRTALVNGTPRVSGRGLDLSSQGHLHCKIKETLFIQELQPSLNGNVGSERLLLY